MKNIILKYFITLFLLTISALADTATAKLGYSSSSYLATYSVTFDRDGQATYTYTDPIEGQAYYTSDQSTSGSARAALDDDKKGNDYNDTLYYQIDVAPGQDWTLYIDAFGYWIEITGTGDSSGNTGNVRLDADNQFYLIVDAPPPVISNKTSVIVDENIGTSTTVTDYYATYTPSWTLQATGDYSYFNINSSNGIITFKNTPNYETKSSYNITVIASGPGGSDTDGVTINLNDLNDNTPTSSNFTLTVEPNTKYRFKASDFPFSDDDGTSANNTFTKLIISSLPSKGVLTYNDINVTLNQEILVSDFTNFKYTPVVGEYGSSYTTFGFKVSDGTRSSSAYIATIDVDNPINLAPTFTTDSNISTPENNVTVATQIQASDVNFTNNAISFDGVDDNANLGKSLDSVFYDSGRKPFTVETWAYLDSSSLVCASSDFRTQFQAMFIEDFTFDMDFHYCDNNALIHVNMGDGTSWDSGLNSSSLEAGKWNHIAVTRDANNLVTIYINGIASGSTTFTKDGNPHASNVFYMGRNNVGEQLFKGDLNDFRIWDKALTSSEINATMNSELNGNEDNLVAYYKLDETSGTAIADSSLNGNNGTFNGTLTSTTQVMDNTTLSYALGSDYNGSLFDINSSTGVITFNSNPDYESNTSYEVNVSVSDGILTTYKLFDINVIDVVEFDTFDSNATATYNTVENNSTVYTFSADNSDVNYTITGGTDSALFDINTTTGELTFKTNPNFDNPTDSDTNNTYEVQVTVTDTNNSTTDIQTLTINLTNDTTEANDNYAAIFDGDGDYVDLGTVSGISDAYSLEAWVYVTSYNSFSRIFDMGTGEARNNIIVNIQETLGYLQMSQFDSSGGSLGTITTQNVVPLDQWVHIAATYDGDGNAKIYFNGTEETITVNTAFSDPTVVDRNSSYIARSNWATDGYFVGKIDEARIWNDVRTPTEITDNMYKELNGDEENLTAYYSFNEGTGLKVNDFANNIDGTMQGDATRELMKFSLDDYRLSFDGDFIAVANSDVSSEVTLSVWVNPTVVQDNWREIFMSGDASDNVRYAIRTNSDGYYIHFGNGSNSAGCTYTTTIPTNQWQHVVGTYSDIDDTIKVYVDGELKNTCTNATFGAINTSGATTHIGKGQTISPRYFSGKIAEVSIFNRDLSSDEITNLANGQKLRGNEDGLVGYWPLNEANGVTANDRSAFGNDGTITGATWQLETELNINTIYSNENTLPIKTLKDDFLTNDWRVSDTVSFSNTQNEFDINSSTGKLSFSDLNYTIADSNYTANITVSGDGVTKVKTYNIKVVEASINKAPSFTTDSNISTPENNVTVATAIDGNDTNITNGAISLSASNDKISANLALSSNSITIEFWGSFNDLTNQQNLINIKEAPSGDAFIPFKAATTNQIAFFLHDGGSGIPYVSDYVINETDEYHHYVFIYDGVNDTVSIFVDGKATSVNNTSSMSVTGSDVNTTTIGSDLDGQFDSNVVYNDIRIWDDVRTPSEINATMNTELNGNEDGLVAYYKLNETSGTDIIDSSLNGYNGALIGTTLPTASTTQVMDDSNLTYALGSDYNGSLFDIDSTTGVLTFNSNPNYEDNISYEVNVSVTDGYLTTYKKFDINVTDMFEITSFDSNASADINMSENNSSVYTFNSQSGDVNWTISGGVDSSLFDINSSTGALSFKTAPDFETPDSNASSNSYIVEVTATNENNISDSITLTINIENVEEPMLSLHFEDQFNDTSVGGWIQPSNVNGQSMDGTKAILTTNDFVQKGGILYDKVFNTSESTVIEFRYYSDDGQTQGGVTDLGNGFSFFIVDGNTTSFTLGDAGDGVGYKKESINPVAGLSGGWIGILTDEYDNDGNGLGNDMGIGLYGSSEFDYLQVAERLTNTMDNHLMDEGYRRIKVTLENNTTNKLMVEWDWNDDGTYDYMAINIDLDDFIGSKISTRPQTYKIGFAATTGWGSNVHAIDWVTLDATSTDGTDVTYTKGGAPIKIDSNLISVSGSTYVQGAQIKITNKISSEDNLYFTNQNNITGSYDTTTGILTLDGNDTKENYQSALRNITYDNNNTDANMTTRAVEYKLKDNGGAYVSLYTKNIVIENPTYINKAPTFTTDANISTPENNVTVGTTIEASDENVTNGAIGFDGSSNYVTMSDTNINISNTLTMESWIYPTNTAGVGHIMGKWDPAGDDGTGKGYLVAISSGKLGVWMSSDGMYEEHFDSNSLIETNKWTHVALVFDGDNQKAYIYINGVLDKNVSSGYSSLYKGTDKFSIGATYDSVGTTIASPSYYFSGSINDVRIWNKALSSSEINSTMNTELNGNEDGLVAYYKLDETSGTAIADSSLNGNNGTFNGTLTSTTQVMDNTTLSYALGSDYNGSLFDINSSTGVITFNSNPDYESNTSYEVNVSVSDGILTTYKLFDINVTDVGESPTFIDLTDVNKTEDDNSFTIELNASVSNGADINITASSSDTSIATVSVVDGNITITPVANANGVVTIEVNATANGLTTTKSFDINISAVDDAPVLGTIEAQPDKNEEFNDYNITLTSSDAEDDNRSYSISSNSSIINATIENNNTLVIKSIENKYGDVNLTIRVRQDSNTSLYTDQNISFRVHPLNDAPTISDISDINQSEDSSNLNVTFQIADVDMDDLNITITNDATSLVSTSLVGDSNKSYAQYNGADINLTIGFIANAFGSANISVSVKDGNNSVDTSSFKVYVPAIIDFPDINQSSISLNEDFGEFNITLTNIDYADGSSADINLSINNSVVTLPSNESGYSDANYTLTLNSIANVSGDANLTISVTANGQIATAILPITITPVNDAPYFLSSQDSTAAQEGVAYSWIPKVADIDNNISTDLTFALISAPFGLEINTTTGELFGQPSYDQSGVYDFNISVSDGIDTSYYSDTISVSNTDRTPIIDAISNIKINEDNVTLVATNIYDPDGDSVSVEVNSSNTSIATVSWNSDGNITISPIQDMYGTISVGVKVTQDSNTSLEATQNFNVTITPVNDAPEIETITNITKDEDFSSFTIEINASDVENDTLTYNAKLNSSDIVTMSRVDNNLTFTSLKNLYGVVRVDFNVSDGNLTSSSSFTITVNDVIDVNITTNNDGSTTLKNTTENNNSVDVNITNPDTNTTTLIDGTTVTENNSSNPKIKLIVTPEGDTNSTVSNGDKNSSVNVGDINKTITINENNETITSLDDFNTTITQKADGTLDINKTEPSKKDIGSELNSTTVDVDENGTTTISGEAGENNITVVLNPNGEVNSSVESPNGKTDLNVNGEIDAETTINEDGSITTVIDDTTITQTGTPSIEVNTTNTNGSTIDVNIEGNTTTSVEANGDIVIVNKDRDETITLGSNGDLNISTNNGGTIDIKNSESNVTIQTDANGNTQTIITNEDGSVDSITINEDGTISIVKKDADGNIIYSKTYPADSNVSVDENGVITVVYVEDGVTLKDTISTDGSVMHSNNSLNSETSVSEDGTITTNFPDTNTTIVKNSDGTVDVNTTTPSQKDISSDLNSTTVNVDENGATTINGEAGDNNITVELKSNGELNSIIKSPNGKSELNVNGELNSTTTISEDGNITTVIQNPNATIKQSGTPNIEVNTTTPDGGQTYVNLEGNNTTSVDANGKIVIDTDKEKVSIHPNGKIEIEPDAGGYIKVPVDNGDTNITTDNNGNTVIENVDSNGFKTKITINADGTMLIETYKADGTLIESQTYPANTSVILGDPVVLYFPDENGVWITKEISSNGIISTTNGDGSTTTSEQKIQGNGDVTTDVTIPPQIDGTVTQHDDNSTTIAIDEGDYSYDINITNTGGLDIDTQGTNGTHNITVANPGADINISSEGNMTITTPTFTNTDGSTCGYTLDIAYDGSDMITKHYLDKGLSSEVITTIIMKIPNSNVDVTSDNKVVHTGSFTNANTKDVNVTATVDCSGNVKTITQIEDQNASLVAVNKPGSTVIIDIDGGVDTTLPLQVTTSNDVKQLRFTVDPNTGDITTQKTFSDDNVSEVVYPVGAKVVANNTNIAEVVVDLSQTNYVQVDVRDENNVTISTKTTIDNALVVNRTSSGEDGKITSEMNVTGATIVIDNFIDGKAKHLVVVDSKETEATSNIEGSEINVTASGVTTTYEDSTTNVKAEVVATIDGKAEHKLNVNGVVTRATSDILGAKTVIDKDANGKAKVVTKVATTNTNNQAIDIEIDAASDGKATQSVTINNVTTKATSKIAGAQTTVKTTGAVETNASINTSTTAIVVALPDGKAIHEVKGSDFDSIATSNILGATTIIDENGTITTDVNNTLSSGYANIAVVTNANGETSVKIITFDNSDVQQDLFEMFDDSRSFPKDNNITIDKDDSTGIIQINTIIPLTEDVRF